MDLDFPWPNALISHTQCYFYGKNLVTILVALFAGEKEAPVREASPPKFHPHPFFQSDCIDSHPLPGNPKFFCTDIPGTFCTNRHHAGYST